MENIINLNELKQSDKKLQKYILSDKFTVYKTKYIDNYNKEDFLKKIELNKFLFHKLDIKNNHSLEFNLECEEFRSIDNFFINQLKNIFNISTEKISKFSWIYTQTSNFTEEWMHNHTKLHRFNKSYIKTDWVCVFYIQIPEEIQNGEGDLIFKDENNNFYSLIPKENDVVIFSGDIHHMTTPNINSKKDRISYVSNFSFFKTK